MANKNHYIVCEGCNEIVNKGEKCKVHMDDLEKIFVKKFYGYSSIEIHRDCFNELVESGQVIRDEDNTWIEI